MTIHVFEVLREHHGDKPYRVGDERELDEMSAHHLVELGVLKKTSRKPTPPAGPVATMRDAADIEIERLKQTIADADAAATSEIAGIAQRVDDARQAGQKELDAMAETLTARRAEIETADAELADLTAKIAVAKAEAPPANKAEGAAPANKTAKA
jgi:hypothetical protein